MDHLDLPENANCHNVIDAMYRISERQLKHCLSEVANIIELVECLDDFDGLAVKEAVDKLNALVVYISGQLKTPAQRKLS